MFVLFNVFYIKKPEENPRFNEYQKSMTELRAKNGFGKVYFSTFAIKV